MRHVLYNKKAPERRAGAHPGSIHDEHYFTLDLGSDYDRSVIDRVNAWASANGIDLVNGSNLDAIRRNFNIGLVTVRISGYDKAVAFHDMWLRNIDHL